MADSILGNVPFVRTEFATYGRTYQLRIERAEDLHRALALDAALWVATGAPLDQLNVDPILAEQLDHNHSGRVLTDELKAAMRWTLSVLTDLGGVTRGSNVLDLRAVDGATEDGEKILRSAAQVLEQLGATDRDRLSLAQIRAVKADVAGRPVSEAGVVIAEAADAPDVSEFITTVIDIMGGVDHPSGKKGLDEPTLDAFLEQARAYLDWTRQARPDGRPDPEILPLGDGTPAAYQCLAAVRDKLDAYFAQCRAVAVDPRLAGHLLPPETELQHMDLASTEVLETLVARAPLAPPNPAGVLAFDDVDNPADASPMGRFRETVCAPLLGADAETLDQAAWQAIKRTFLAFEQWTSARPADAVARLPEARLEQYLDPDLAEAVRTLIARSRETAIVLEDIRLTERLVLLQANLLQLANNFVSFPHLYDPTRRALFEQGTLIMDGRRFNLAVKVDNLKNHIRMAKTSEIFVLYVEVKPGRPDAFKLAIPVTAGGKGNLCRGKHGVFHHVDGHQYDAVVTDLIENPISILEAMTAPFKKIGSLVTGKIESMTTEASKKLEKETSAAVSEVKASATQGTPGKTPASAPAAVDTGARHMAAGAAGMAAGWGVAIAALGSSLAYVTKTLSSLSLLSILGGIAGAVLAVVLPASLVTAIRLRRRDLSAILEGSGWAINARMRLTWSQSRFFTQVPGLTSRKTLAIRIVTWLTTLAVVVGLLFLARYAFQAAHEIAPEPDTSTPAGNVAP